MASIHFKTAFSSIRRSPFQAAAAIVVLTITFFVITTLSILVYSSNNLLKYFETRPQIIAFLKDSAKADEVSLLQGKLSNDERIKSVKYVAKDEALAIYKEATSDNPLLSELVSPSIFPASLEFSVKDLNFAKDVIEQVKKENVVDQVGFTANIGGESNLQDSVERLRTITKYVRVGGGIFVGILTLTSFLVLLVIISMRLTTRRQEVEILDLIGATSAFIKKPIVIEAFSYAFIGVALGWVLGVILTLYSTPALISYFKEIAVLPRETFSLLKIFGVILFFELMVGSLLAFFGSSLAVSRAKKVK